MPNINARKEPNMTIIVSDNPKEIDVLTQELLISPKVKGILLKNVFTKHVNAVAQTASLSDAYAMASFTRMLNNEQGALYFKSNNKKVAAYSDIAMKTRALLEQSAKAYSNRHGIDDLATNVSHRQHKPGLYDMMGYAKNGVLSANVLFKGEKLSLMGQHITPTPGDVLITFGFDSRKQGYSNHRLQEFNFTPKKNKSLAVGLGAIAHQVP